MKIINSKVHGLIDYATVVLLLLSPSLFGMDGTLATFTYILGGVHFLLTILTAFEPGLIKIIPFRIHGWIELAVAVVLAGVAFWFNTLGNTTGFYFYLVLLITIFLVYLLTDFTSVRHQREAI